MCPKVGHTPEHNHWLCVAQKCGNCPQYSIPVEEQDTSIGAPTISFSQYKNFTSCSQHNKIPLNATVCLQCGTSEEPLVKKLGCISTRKHYTKHTTAIGTFMTDHYIPLLKKYGSHLNHVVMLSKQH